MRRRTAGDMCHWKLMIFAQAGGGRVVGRELQPARLRAERPLSGLRGRSHPLLAAAHAVLQEGVRRHLEQHQPSYADYANVTRPLVRNYPTVVVDSRLNFPPRESYQNRLVPLIDKEPASGLIDVDMFRLTMARPIDAIIRAAARGVRVRMYLEPRANTPTPRDPGTRCRSTGWSPPPRPIQARLRSGCGRMPG